MLYYTHIQNLIQTAKANGLCVERYLDYVLNNINRKNIDELLPWSKELPKELPKVIKTEINSL